MPKADRVVINPELLSTDHHNWPYQQDACLTCAIPMDTSRITLRGSKSSAPETGHVLEQMAHVRQVFC